MVEGLVSLSGHGVVEPGTPGTLPVVRDLGASLGPCLLASPCLAPVNFGKVEITMLVPWPDF